MGWGSFIVHAGCTTLWSVDDALCRILLPVLLVSDSAKQPEIARKRKFVFAVPEKEPH
jgi:hypothetical protein